MRALTFGKWLITWYKTYKVPYMKSHINIEIIIRLHIPENVKAKKLNDLTTLDIQKVINGCKKSRTSQDLFDVLRASLIMAYNLELMKKDITRMLVKPKHERVLGKRLDVQELADFFEKLQGERLEYFYKFCVYTGCRRGEALRITWSDINYIDMSIHIPGTKTKKSDRYIPLFPEVVELLENVPKTGEKIFNHRAEYVSKKIHDYTTHTLKDLRHTFGSICNDCGVAIKILQGYMGHSRLQTTSETYVHVLDTASRIEGTKVRFLNSKPK